MPGILQRGGWVVAAAIVVVVIAAAAGLWFRRRRRRRWKVLTGGAVRPLYVVEKTLPPVSVAAGAAAATAGDVAPLPAAPGDGAAATPATAEAAPALAWGKPPPPPAERNLHDLLTEPRLLELVSHITNLPTQPASYLEIQREALKSDASVDRVGQMLARDMSLAASVLRIVNSAYYGLPRTISNPTEAVMLIGLDTVRSLLLSINIFDGFSRLTAHDVSVKALYAHSLACAGYARRIAQSEGATPRLVDHCFTGALLHDVGKLVLGANLPDEYERARTLALGQGGGLLEAEVQVFGATHAAVGAYLLDQWDLPVPVVEAVAYHHAPPYHRGDHFGPLAAVYVADWLDHSHTETGAGRPAPAFDATYLEALRLDAHLPAWRAGCDELAAHAA